MLKLSQENEEQMKEDEGRSCSNTHEDCNNTADNGDENFNDFYFFMCSDKIALILILQ